MNTNPCLTTLKRLLAFSGWFLEFAVNKTAVILGALLAVSLVSPVSATDMVIIPGTSIVPCGITLLSICLATHGPMWRCTFRTRNRGYVLG